MDPVSHVVFASALHIGIVRPLHSTADARTASVDARSRSRGTALATTLGALSPDIDAALMFSGWDRYLVAHEIGTHSVAGAVVCGLLAAGVARLVRPGSSYARLIVPAAVGALSHIAGDLLSGASIRLAWPLLDTRVSNLGVVSMGEPLLVGAALAGGIAMWIGKSRRVQIAVALLCAFGLLIASKSLVRERAERVYLERVTGASNTYLVEPVSMTLTEWKVLDRTHDQVRAWTVTADGRVELFPTAPIMSGDRRFVEASMSWPTVRNFQRAHEFPFAVATDSGVEWSDLRYCASNEPDGERVPECTLWAGGRFAEPPALAQLVVRVGGLIQTR